MQSNNEISNSAVMTGKTRAGNYLSMQKVFSNLYLGKFFQVMNQFQKTGRFLEIGSGPGYQTAQVFEKLHPYEIICVEPSPDMIATAQSFLAHVGISASVDLRTGYVEDSRLLYSLGKFDLIFSTLSLHHWGDPVLAFRNLAGALKPDGVIIIHDFRRIEFPFRVSLHPDSHRAYSADDLAGILKKTNINRFELLSSFPFQILIINAQDLLPMAASSFNIETLDVVPPDQEAAIVAIQTNEECSKELWKSGFIPATRVKVINRDSSHIVCAIAHKRVVLDRETASGISVLVC